MSSRKFKRIRSVLCAVLILASALTLGVIYTNEKPEAGTSSPKAESKTADESKATQPIGDKEAAVAPVTLTLAASIPELSCKAIVFDEDNIVFADPANNYEFIRQGKSADTFTVTDDTGHSIRISKTNNALAIYKDDVQVEEFVFKRHLIQLAGNILYYDNSPVQYKSTSFSAYKLSEDYTLECVAKGKYRLRNAEGKVVNSCTLKDSSGAKIKIFADDSGFYAEGVDDKLFYNVFKLNENAFYINWDYLVYIDGNEVVPEGYNDTYVNPEYSVGSNELTPKDPPVNYGDVNTENADLSDLTAEMLEYVNLVREQYGIQKLYGLQLLDEAAAVRAAEIVQNYSHTRPDETDFTTAINSNGLLWHSGECIAKSSSESSIQVFETLLCSEENRAVLLDPKLKYLSAACEKSGSDYYWELLLFNDTYVPDT